MPVYNVEKALPDCIESVLAQTYDNLEIILVNDGSTDGSEAVCEAYVSRDSRCILKSIPNGGVGNARNVGLGMVTGEYVVFMDSDDLLVPDFVEILLNAAEKEDLPIVSCGYHLIPASHVTKEWPHKMQDMVIVDVQNHYDVTASYGKRNVTAAIFKKDVLEGITFDTDLYVGEDAYFFAQVLCRCEKVGWIDCPMYGYIIYSVSATRGVYNEKKHTFRMAYERICRLFEEQPFVLNNFYAVYGVECAEAIKWVNYYHLDKVTYDYAQLCHVLKDNLGHILRSNVSKKKKITCIGLVYFKEPFLAFWSWNHKRKIKEV